MIRAKSLAALVEISDTKFLHRLIPVGFMVSGFSESYGRSHPDVEAVHTDQKRTRIKFFDDIDFSTTVLALAKRLRPSGFDLASRWRHIRIFEYTQFVKPLREQIRDHAEALAKRHDFQIEFIRKKSFRKEQRIKYLLKQRGYKPGLVHILNQKSW